MTPEISSNSSPTQPTTPEETLPSELQLATAEENTDSENDDEPGYDEPTCHWTPAKHQDEDCGEGVICPPCG